MAAAMKVALFFLLFGVIWTHKVSTEFLDTTTTLKISKEVVTSVPGETSASWVSTFSEAPNLNSVTPYPAITGVPEEVNSTRHQISPPSSDLYTATEVSFSGTPTAASSDLHESESMASWEVSSKESSNLEISANRNSAEPLRHSLALHVMADRIMATDTLETSTVASEPFTIMVTDSLETSAVASGPLTTMATGSLETTTVASGPLTIMAADSLETSAIASGPLTTMAADSLETSAVASGPLTTVATGSLETSAVASGPLTTVATGSLETSTIASGPLTTMAADSLETSAVASGPLTTVATGSLETSAVASGPLTTVATGSLETSAIANGPPTIMAADSLETSTVASGPSTIMATNSLETPKGASGFPISTVKIFTNRTSGDSQPLGQELNRTQLVAVLVAVLVVIVLLGLLLLWRQRQKRRTGALTLGRGGKRNGVVDAWAGPARVCDEEALTAAAGGPGGERSPGVSEVDGSGQQPMLTTFFEKRKSHRDSVELVELEARSAPVPKGEEEPLMDNKEEAAEVPASEGPEAGEVEAPQCF
ncbi:leukosialin [Canis lupus familiaris]|uniref:Sialophorin n=1 Tax=Canis lupus familiaris TaxID=9615 RepID=A0A8P0PRY2_CANLF|nr:leukosialin [Canis lupus familiaris]|eukprot:XP_022275570.1 leukosialin [Canis lupus familiaris]